MDYILPIQKISLRNHHIDILFYLRMIYFKIKYKKLGDHLVGR